MIFKNFRNGINLGGWLSQYEFISEQPLNIDNLEKHFQSFITEKDLKQIASWGFDHVRLPVSGYLLYDPAQKRLNLQPVHYIEKCVQWCAQFHLNLILDLHDLWGNVYGAMDSPMPLLTDSDFQDNFFEIWNQLSRYFNKDLGCIVLFELLNEVSDATGYLWNRLYKKAIKIIHINNPTQPILVGCNCQNNVAYLNQLDLIENPYIFYNFHYYDPQVFTHQKAHFSEEMMEFNKTITYPGDISDFVDFIDKHPQYYLKYSIVADEPKNDKALMNKLLKNAIDFVHYSGCQLYCGEFGVIDSAPPAEAIKWITDLVEILDQHKIGHAIWNYKSLDFGLLDVNNHVVSNELLDSIIELNAARS